MNTSIDPAEATSTLAAAANSGGQFSRSNVFGMFLTLQLCQLTQPYGSLLFRGAGGFFWRCNPIASLVEAVMILWYMAVAVARSPKDGRAPMVKRLQETAGGLLLLRGAIGKDDLGGLMSKLMAGSFLDRDDEQAQEHADDVEMHEQAPASSTGRARPTDLDEHPAPVSRQPTLEANRQPRRTDTLPDSDPQSEKSRILREAFGSNALAHRELRVDLFTIATQLFVVIKLVAVSGNSWFTAGAMFLIIGWVAVQVLLMLFHLREMKELEMAAAVRITRTLNAELKEHSDAWMLLFLTLHLPLFGYPPSLIAYRPWIPADVGGFVGFIKSVGEFFGMIISFSMVQVGFWGGLINLLAGLGKTPGLFKIPFVVIFTPIWLWFVASSISYTFQNGPEGGSKYTPANFTSFYEPATPMYYIVDQGWSYFMDTVLLLVLTAAMVLAYYLAFYATEGLVHKDRLSRMRVSAGNVAFTVIIFAIYLASYDSTTTFKPWWTDLLG